MYQTHNNPTALGLACMKGHTAVAELLLDGGANINFQDRVRHAVLSHIC